MTRVLLWKELREQGTIVAALVVLGCGVLVAGAIVLDPGEAGRATELRSLANAGRLALVMLALTAGVVVGGTLFAGEREARTFTFLDQLPAARWSVWWRKVLAGAGLVAAATAAFLVASVATGLLNVVASGRGGGFVAWVLLIGAIAFAAYGWGVFGSVLSRTSLAACGTGLGVAATGGFFLFLTFGVALVAFRRQFPATRWFAGPESSAWELAFQLTGYVLLAFPVPAAAFLYTGPDRARRFADLTARVPGLGGVVRSGLFRASGVRWGGSFRRLVWLTTRQARGSGLGLIVAGLVGGVALAPADTIPIVIWPVLALLAGVLVGVVGVADEQTSGAFRFWGERRMPAGRLWLAKVGSGLALTLAVLVALLVAPAVAHLAGDGRRGPAVAAVFRTPLFLEHQFPVVSYLLVWPAYGFACGHVAGLLFRKSVVAAAVAILTGGTLAGLWLPSLLSGGVRGWQVFAPAAALLLTARLLVWAWATDRLGTRRALARLAVGTACVLGVAGFGVAYRVAEVEAVPEVEDDLAFSAALPSFDEKQGGRDLRRAVSLYSGSDPAVRPAGARGLAADPADKRERLGRAFVRGWPASDRGLDDWLDAKFVGGWEEPIRAAAAKPLGVLEDPNEFTLNTASRYSEPVREMTDLMMAHAMRAQVRGDHAVLPAELAVVLPVARTARNNTFDWATRRSLAAEWSAYDALDRWLERLAGRPELVRVALAAVTEHDARDPFDPRAVQLAHQTLLRNVVLAPSRALPRYLDANRPGVPSTDLLSPTSAAADAETALISFAWTVPWEQERLRRVVGRGNGAGPLGDQFEQLSGAPGLLAVYRPSVNGRADLVAHWKRVVAVRRASVLKLAVRLYESDTGAPPKALADLVPKYLPAVPADPFDGRPFRYRVSRGETLEFEADERDQPENDGMPPGTTPPYLLSWVNYLAVAGVGGGLVCWPVDSEPVGFAGPSPLVPPFGGGALMPAGVSAASPPPLWVRPAPAKTRESVTVPAGRGILWSVGADGRDDGGTAEPARAAMIAGDLLFVVPSPARPEK